MLKDKRGAQQAMADARQAEIDKFQAKHQREIDAATKIQHLCEDVGIGNGAYIFGVKSSADITVSGKKSAGALWHALKAKQPRATV